MQAIAPTETGEKYSYKDNKRSEVEKQSWLTPFA